MKDNVKIWENNARIVLNNVSEIVERIDLQYLLIWSAGVVMILLAIFFLSRVSKLSSRRITKIVEIPKKKLSQPTERAEKNHGFLEFKTRVMIDHTKSLRLLHEAAERCYIKKNALKCIQIVTYCPHLVNVISRPSGLTPFHRVCYHGHACLMEFMLNKGANPWLTTTAGETALCLAIHAAIKTPTTNLICLDILQKRGCYLDHTNKWYRIYLEAALITGNQALAKWLFSQASLLGTRCSSFPPRRI